MSDSPDVIEAVTSSDPNRTYARILTEHTTYWSVLRRLWVVAVPGEVAAVLAHPGCRVRPLAEPVPRALQGTRIGEVFSRLVRMNDGDAHARGKAAVSKALTSVDIEQARSTCRRLAKTLAPHDDLDRFQFELPVMSVAHLLGVPDALLPRVIADTGHFVRALSPAADREDCVQGNAATNRLGDILEVVLAGRAPWTLLFALAQALAADGNVDPEVIVANAIGFLFQAHDATAGLIGNTVVHLARNRDALNRAVPLYPQVERLVGFVARDDASVQNTRRFVAQDDTVNGMAFAEGDVVLVTLAAANSVSDDRSWSFGDGPHACPGKALALMIAAVGVTELLESEMVPRHIPEPVRYQPLPNARIPEFASTFAQRNA
ncbi:cytochrome P450 [soil metagenome]